MRKGNNEREWRCGGSAQFCETLVYTRVQCYEFQIYDWRGSKKIVEDEKSRIRYGQWIFASECFGATKKATSSVSVGICKEGGVSVLWIAKVFL